MRDLSDSELYNLCREYGSRALEWRRKFIGLLPEVNRRRLFSTKGFSSIFEFAAKLAGVSKEQVKLALSLDESFRDKPCLRERLVSGDVSVHKLVRVRGVATGENQEFLSQQVERLSKSALEVFVADIKKQDLLPGQNSIFHSGMGKNQSETLQLSSEVEGKLLELQGKGIDINELLLELLKQRDLALAQEKEEISATLPETSSRYIPAKVKAVVRKEYGDRCSMPTCARPAQDLHHKVPFALSKIHAPHLLAPLCKEHHQIAHAIHARVQERRRRT